VTVHDLGRLADERPFLCMKFIRGRDLGEILGLLRRGDPDARRSYGRVRLLSIFQGVCHGLAYAHERGVIHRDMKPRNIMIGEHGEVSIVDWGLAKTVGRDDPEPSLAEAQAAATAREAGLKLMPELRVQTGTTDRSGKGSDQSTVFILKGSGEPHAPFDPSVTKDGEIVGTPAYMAPEQARGVRGLTTSVDIYALGAILYEILCYRAPYEGSNALSVIRKVIDGNPVPPRLRGRDKDRSEPDPPPPHVPEELERLCLQCMERELDRRPASADEGRPADRGIPRRLARTFAAPRARRPPRVGGGRAPRAVSRRSRGSPRPPRKGARPRARSSTRGARSSKRERSTPLSPRRRASRTKRPRASTPPSPAGRRRSPSTRTTRTRRPP